MCGNLGEVKDHVFENKRESAAIAVPEYKGTREQSSRARKCTEVSSVITLPKGCFFVCPFFIFTSSNKITLPESNN
jgi:hypothetical protein